MAKIVVAKNIPQRLQQTFLLLIKNPWIFLFPFLTYTSIFGFSFFLSFLESKNTEIYNNIPFSLIVSIIFLLLLVGMVVLPTLGALSCISLQMQGKKIEAPKLWKLVKEKFLPFLGVFLRVSWSIAMYPFIFFLLSILAYFTISLAGPFLLSFSEFLLFIFFLIKFPRLLLSFPIITDQKITSKEAIQTSQEISKGHWWNIFGNLLIVSIITSTFAYLIFIIEKYAFNFLNITPRPEFSLSLLIQGSIGVLLQTVIIGFVLVYFFLFYKHYSQDSK